MKDGTEATVRPIRPEDEPLVVRFHETLSERSVYFRYFHMMNLERRISHERLTRICFIDYDREMALVVERKDAVTGACEILGIGRLTRLREGDAPEFAILVSDQVQRLGLGTELLRRLVEVGRSEGVATIKGYIVPENVGMQAVSKNLGFTVTYSPEEEVMVAELRIRPGA
jgi:acetyltransferase